MNHQTHESHSHVHGENCGHTRIQHDGHWDFLHDGHLHTTHENHFDEHIIAVSDQNPADCSTIECACQHDDCEHEKVPHGDHVDHLIDGRLHFRHSGHCDDHGAITVM
ncbi:MAG TPA: hypothetical protein VK892_23235 [Pyrinomonadaceae bacterium]|nr:hypothetical protein [Pyrinomonadaceae bacterium]